MASTESGHYFTAYRGADFLPEGSRAVEATPYETLRRQSCRVPYAGRTVVIHGIGGREDLNGKRAEALAFCTLSGRYQIQLKDTGQLMKLKPRALCGHARPGEGPCVVCRQHL